MSTASTAAAAPSAAAKAGMRVNGKQWHETKKAFRPTAGQTSYAKRVARESQQAETKKLEQEMKTEKEAERQRKVQAIKDKRAAKEEKARDGAWVAAGCVPRRKCIYGNEPPLKTAVFTASDCWWRWIMVLPPSATGCRTADGACKQAQCAGRLGRHTEHQEYERWLSGVHSHLRKVAGMIRRQQLRIATDWKGEKELIGQRGLSSDVTSRIHKKLLAAGGKRKTIMEDGWIESRVYHERFPHPRPFHENAPSGFAFWYGPVGDDHRRGLVDRPQTPQPYEHLPVPRARPATRCVPARAPLFVVGYLTCPRQNLLVQRCFMSRHTTSLSSFQAEKPDGASVLESGQLTACAAFRTIPTPHDGKRDNSLCPWSSQPRNPCKHAIASPKVDGISFPPPRQALFARPPFVAPHGPRRACRQSAGAELAETCTKMLGEKELRGETG
nr:rrna-processing protein cgra [Quercus suber]